MIEALHFDFMQNALAAGILTSIICGIIGTLIVVNRLVFLSGGIAHSAYGGIGLMHQLVRELQLAEAIDARLQLFKIHLPYHESDHVLNLAYNALCDARCLEDLELRRPGAQNVRHRAREALAQAVVRNDQNADHRGFRGGAAGSVSGRGGMRWRGRNGRRS